MASNDWLRALSAPGLDEVQGSWSWFVTIGVALVLLGVVCVAGQVTATRVTVVTFGWLLVLGAVLSFIQMFRLLRWSGAILYFLSAALRGALGLLLIRYPFSAEVSLTVVLAYFFWVGGISRAIGAGMLQFPRWGWAVVSGLVAVALGVMLLTQLPSASLWFIGLAIGIEFILDGVSFVALGSALRGIQSSRPLAKAS